MRVLIRFPLDTFHNPIEESAYPDTRYSPSPENTTLNAGPEYPESVLTSSQLDTFHNIILQSKDPDAKYFLSSENTTLITALE